MRPKLPGSDLDFSSLPTDRRERHEALVDLFGQYLFWHRNRTIASCRNFVESEEARERLGKIWRICYEAVSKLPPEQQDDAIRLAEETLNGFLQTLIWSLGDEGEDARFGPDHAYRFRIVMEIVDVDTHEIVEEYSINRHGKFFGDYWGRWLNRHKDK